MPYILSYIVIRLLTSIRIRHHSHSPYLPFLPFIIFHLVVLVLILVHRIPLIVLACRCMGMDCLPGPVCPTPNTARLVELPTNSYGEPISTVTITQFGISSPPRRKRRASISELPPSSSSKVAVPDKLFLTAKTAAKDIIVRRQLRSLSARVRPKDYDEFLNTQDLLTKKNNSNQSTKPNNQSGELGEKKEWESQWGLRKNSGRDREQEKEELSQQSRELKTSMAAQKAMRIAYENTMSGGERRWQSPFKTTSTFNLRGAAAATYPSTKDKRIWMPAFERSYNVRAVASERAATQIVQSLASTAWKDIKRQRQHHTPSYGQFMTEVLVDTSASSSTTNINDHGHPSSPMSTSSLTKRYDASPTNKVRSPSSSSTNTMGQRLNSTTSKLPLKAKLMDFPEPTTNDILHASAWSTDLYTINSSSTLPSWKPPGATSITKKLRLPRNKPVLSMKVTIRKT